MILRTHYSDAQLAYYTENPALLQKGLRCRISPTCTLSQNGYGAIYGASLLYRPGCIRSWDWRSMRWPSAVMSIPRCRWSDTASPLSSLHRKNSAWRVEFSMQWKPHHAKRINIRNQTAGGHCWHRWHGTSHNTQHTIHTRQISWETHLSCCLRE